jgi:hypothetical protein
MLIDRSLGVYRHCGEKRAMVCLPGGPDISYIRRPAPAGAAPAVGHL